MGNSLSEEEEKQIMDEAYNLEDPDADRFLNSGTAAPNCQPGHTTSTTATTSSRGNGSMTSSSSNNNSSMINTGDDRVPASHKHRRASSTLSEHEEKEERRKRQQTAASAATGGSNNNVPNGDPVTAAAATATSAAAEEEQKKLSYYQMAKLGYQELVNAIIRPPRADYKMEALGPPAFTFCGKRFTRTDFTLRTKRGYNLECSHWEPVERVTDRIPIVIYMHGNSSARVEVLPQLSYLLSLGVAVFAFDFAGSGKSDGEYVSLGYYEREDLSCIVAHLRATNVVSTIALWGRSMGAATALMFGDRDPSIACMILDSPFADLTQLAEEMVEKGRDQGIVVPTFVVSVALRMIQGSVKKQANVNIKHISPIAHADKCFIPALFVAGEHDDFIKKHHAEAIYEKYAGDKNIIIVEGDHNSPRPKFMFDSASIFLQTCLQIPNAWALPVPASMNLMCPPWYFEMFQNRNLRAQQRKNSATGASMHSRASSSSRNGSRNGGFDGDHMGMTQERQREIQASLFKMLGQADDPMMEQPPPDDTTSSSSHRGRRSAPNGPPPPQHQHDLMSPTPPPPPPQQPALPIQDDNQSDGKPPASKSTDHQPVKVAMAIPFDEKLR